jgi:mannose-6-phosphate isomerase-like protein (cupin superfamily)
LSEREIVCEDLNLAIDDLRRDGFRLDVIYPADQPYAALLSNGDATIRVMSRVDAPRPSRELPTFQSEFVLTRCSVDGGAGRAGMIYRDLIPSRLGGRYIASHISIPDGGPVADWVHFHRIAFQLIVVRSGWVRVVYEDQGDPFVMETGDMVLQPPRIRHRVLESSPALEVVEITAPALHETFADHALGLPNGSNPARIFDGQRFVHHIARGTNWAAFLGAEAQETAIADATSGLAEVRNVRPGRAAGVDFPSHEGELVFGFVLYGSAQLSFLGNHSLGSGDAFVIPPGEPWSLRDASTEFRLLHVTTSRLG